jgi:TPR repeat protein
MKTLTMILSLCAGAVIFGASGSMAQAAMPEEVITRGEKLVEQGKLKEAFELTLPFAKSGDADAQFALGVLLLSDGIKLPSEYLGVARSRLALCWVEKAALQGNAEACSLLADSYEKGFNGVTVNPKLAEMWRSLSKQAAR